MSHKAIPFRQQNSPSESLPVPMEPVGAALRELGCLRRCIEEIVHHSSWLVTE